MKIPTEELKKKGSRVALNEQSNEVKKSDSQYNKITWSPASSILGTVFIYVLAQMVAVVILAGYFSVKDWDTSQIEFWLDTSVWAQFWYVLAISIATIGLTALLIKSFKSSLRSVGLKRPKWADLWWALTGYVVYFLMLLSVLGLALALFPGIDNGQAQDIGFATTTSGAALALVFVSLVILPAITEEVLFRGFLFSGLRTKLPFWSAAIITSLMFGAVHLQFGGGESLLWTAAIDTFILSMVMVYMRERTGSLLPSIILHGVKNGLAFSVLFVF